MHALAYHINFGSSISTSQMESEWAMALYNHSTAGANTNTNGNKKRRKKPDTKTCNTHNANTLCVKKCVVKKALKKMLKCSPPATQGFNFNVLQFKLGPVDCSSAPQKWRVGSTCAGMLTSQLPPTHTKTMLSWYCECNPVARQFLDANFPGAPNFFDAPRNPTTGCLTAHGGYGATM